jgi:uncharacterized protein YqeY
MSLGLISFRFGLTTTAVMKQKLTTRALVAALLCTHKTHAFSPYFARTFHASSSVQSLGSSIADDVMDQMKVAMKQKDTTRLSTIRLVRAAFANAAIELRVDQLDDDQAMGVLRKMAKTRVDSIKMYQDNNAPDRAAAEQEELNIINSWLPGVADEATTRKWVLEALESVAAESATNMGKVMGALMKNHKNEIDGSLAQTIVKEEIAKRKAGE